MTATHQPTNPPQCPTCEYNLTGLTEQRCPECGEPFDWGDVFSKAADPVTIAFERARGVGRIRGFVVTWATVLFAPWIFARQVCQHVSLKSAIIFGAACCIPVTIRAFFDLGVRDYAAWMTTICLHILAQAVILSILDPNTLREGWRAIQFWIAAGGYTTAVVATECYGGPPVLDPKGLEDFILAIFEGRSPNSGVMLDYGSNAWLGWATILLWLMPVTWCYVVRLKICGVRGSIRTLMTPLVAGGLLILYSYTSGRLAPRLWGAFGGTIG